jgi:hypothetical protein
LWLIDPEFLRVTPGDQQRAPAAASDGDFSDHSIA